MAKLFELRGVDQADRYGKRLSKKKGLDAKVAELAAIRSEEGYMAEWQREEDGTITLIENNCPICAAAETCQDLCQNELRLFRQLLGPVEIERQEHILAGQRRCLYRIRKAA